MNRETSQGIMVFFAFFLIGLAIYSAVNSSLAPSKPMVQEETGPTGAVSDVAARVSPSVVGISNLQKDGRIFDGHNSQSTGSGVVLDREGYIVTNNHVVRGADHLLVTLVDGQEREAKIVGTDPRTDLALIKIKSDRRLTPAVFGNSDNLTVGQEVVAIGNPLGLRFARSVTAGVVSGLNRLLTTEEGFVYRLIQTDAAINPGNSGGALVDLDGRLVGINTAKIAAEGFEGMGFSIPANQVDMVVEQIRSNGKVTRPLLGVRIIGELSQDQARYYQLPVKHGVVVEPHARGPADRAGLKQYDIITRIDRKEVQTSQELQETLFDKKVGQVVRVQLMRLPEVQGGKVEVRTFEVKLDG